MVDRLHWMQLRELDAICILRQENQVDFVIIRSLIGNATIMYFRSEDVGNQIKPLLDGLFIKSNAQYGGFDGIRIERPIEEVRDDLSKLRTVAQVKLRRK